MHLQTLFLVVVTIWEPYCVTAHPLVTRSPCRIEDLKEAGTPECLTPECVSEAARILEYIDPSVDPCDNFYEFACGGWMKDHILPHAKDSLESFEDVDKMIARVRNLLMEEPKASDLNSVKIAKDLFASCMNYEHDPEAVHPLKEFIDEEFGGWPLTREKLGDSKYDLDYFLKQAARYGVSPLFSFGVKVYENEDDDGAVQKYHVLTIGTPDFGLPSAEYYTSKDDIIIQSYRARIYAMAESFQSLVYSEEIEKLIDVEMALAQHVLAANATAQESDATFSDMALGEIVDNYGEIVDWRDFVTSLISSPEVGITDVTDDVELTVNAPVYFEKVSKYLPTLSNLDLHNYIVWRVIDSFEKTRIPEDQRLGQMVDKAASIDTFYAPEEGCVPFISKAFELVVHRLLYADIFPMEEMTKITEMMKNIQDALNDSVEQLDWADEYTKKQIKDKNAAIRTSFVYFNRVMNDTYLENYYANMVFNRKTFFKNLAVERRESVRRNLRLLIQPVLFKSVFESYKQDAHHDFVNTVIRISAAMFDPPFFSRHIPQSLNYGGIGTTLGHELLHGFDATGYKYNIKGVEGQWWSEQAILKFKESHKCMIQQYDHFYSEKVDMNLNGTLTLDENIADLGGVKQAFLAYKKWLCSQGQEEPRLPAVNYTHPQLFFISFAHTFCGLNSESSLRYLITEDQHSLSRFRVIGTAQNSWEFAKAFDCPTDSYMNPQKKCEIY